MQTYVPQIVDDHTQALLALGYNPLNGVDPILHRDYFREHAAMRKRVANRLPGYGPLYVNSDGYVEPFYPPSVTLGTAASA